VLGDFHLPGAELRKKGLNRIGNLLVPNSNYCAFEDWVVPILDDMVREQEEEGTRWSPSTVIARLGREIRSEESVYYWCWKVSGMCAGGDWDWCERGFAEQSSHGVSGKWWPGV
jgi:deoxyhypusine synthase